MAHKRRGAQHEALAGKGSPLSGMVAQVAMAGAVVLAKQVSRRDFIRVDQAVVIERTPEEVFAFVTNTGALSQWVSEIIEVGQITPGPLGVGSRLHYTAKVAAVSVRRSIQLIEYKPATEIGVRITWGITPIEISLRFEPVDQGTRVTATISGDVLAIAQGASEAIAKRAVGDDLSTLKRLIENCNTLALPLPDR